MLCATDYAFHEILRNIHCIDIPNIHANTRKSSCSPSLILNSQFGDVSSQNNGNNSSNNNKSEVKLIDWIQNILNEFCTAIETDTDNAHLQKSNAIMNEK